MRAPMSRILSLVISLCAAAMAASAQVPVKDLQGQDVLSLQEDFNAHPERVRLLLLLSPGCGHCLETSGEVEKLLQEISDERVQVMVVWEPLLRTDSYDEAQKKAELIPDPRAVHYWEPGRVLALEYGERLPLPGKFNFAVDMVLLFDPDVAWTGASLPMPGVWFHKLGDDERTFSPEKLRHEIRKRLESSSAAPRSTPERRENPLPPL